jgi:pimeloyl-ACP methyl ester carboxylesterase
MTTPTTLLLGEVSVPELRAGYQEIASALPNVRVQVLRGQDHLVHLSDPEQFANQVLDFIQ